MKKIFLSFVLFFSLILLSELYVRSDVNNYGQNEFSAEQDFKDLTEILSDIKENSLNNIQSIVFVGNSHTLCGVDSKKMESIIKEDKIINAKVYNLSFSTINPITVMSVIQKNGIRPDLIILDVSFRTSYSKVQNINDQNQSKSLSFLNNVDSSAYDFESVIEEKLKENFISLTWNHRLSQKIKNMVISWLYEFKGDYLEIFESLFKVNFKKRELGGNLKANVEYPLGKDNYINFFKSELCQNEIERLHQLSDRFDYMSDSPMFNQITSMLGMKYNIGLIRLPVHTCMAEQEKNIFSKLYQSYSALSEMHTELRFFVDFNVSENLQTNLDSYFYDPDHLNEQGAGVLADRLVELIYKKR